MPFRNRNPDFSAYVPAAHIPHSDSFFLSGDGWPGVPVTSATARYTSLFVRDRDGVDVRDIPLVDGHFDW